MTDLELQKMLTEKGLGTNPYAVYAYAKQNGLGPSQIDNVLGAKPGESEAWLTKNNLTLPGHGVMAPSSQIKSDMTDEQARQFFKESGTASNPYAMFAYAKNYGVSPDRMDSIMQAAPGTAQAWLKQANLTLPGMS